MLKFIAVAFTLIPSISLAQDGWASEERFPVFPECRETELQGLEDCFRLVLLRELVADIQSAEERTEKSFSAAGEENFTSEAGVLFEVTREGRFQALLIETPYKELQDQLRLAFEGLPLVDPATYINRPVSMQFRMRLRLPHKGYEPLKLAGPSNETEVLTSKDIDAALTEVSGENEVATDKNVDSGLKTESAVLFAGSRLNIPFSHQSYSRFDQRINQRNSDFHSAIKPYLYREVAIHHDFVAESVLLKRDKKTWLGRKLWNEHLVQVEGADYWFTFDVAADLRVGRESNEEDGFTFNNTRAVVFQGGLGENLNFYSSYYESQAKFAQYFNNYAEAIRPAGGNPAVIPGRGIAKPIYDDAYDYPVAEAYLSWDPSRFFNIQLGYGKNFIGDGYRSLFLSDVAPPYPYFKLNTSFWRFKYTNTWMSLRDVRPEVTGDGSFRTTYMASHFLSINLTNRLNLGLFEAVMWENDNNRGVDFAYLNPVIFFRAIEFATGGRAGNVLMGLSGKYAWTDKFNTYGQLVIDEFNSAAVFGGEQSWKNKQGFQLGLKYYEPLKITGLQLQLEYNQVRPYTYSHNTVTLNYGHSNQPMAHLWGANFRELVGIGRYNYGRYYAFLKAIYGERGLDFNSAEDLYAYGGDIYRSEEDRPYENGVKVGQGNKASSLYAEVEVGYILNPAIHLQVFGNLIFRSLDPMSDNDKLYQDRTLWFTLGIRTDLFNWYFDL